jgi:AcrR family transcriptional regulator
MYTTYAYKLYIDLSYCEPMARPAQIDRTAVLEESLRLADEQGLGAVTMAAVAQRLGVTPMALYRHVANKADLLDGLVEVLLGEFALPESNVAWDDRLAEIGDAIRATARRHPDVFVLLLRRSASTPDARHVRDAIYAALREAGMAEAEIPQTERLVSTMVLGFAASEAGGRFSSLSRAAIDADYEALEDFVRALITQRLR